MRNIARFIPTVVLLVVISLGCHHVVSVAPQTEVPRDPNDADQQHAVDPVFDDESTGSSDETEVNIVDNLSVEDVDVEVAPEVTVTVAEVADDGVVASSDEIEQEAEDAEGLTYSDDEVHINDYDIPYEYNPSGLQTWSDGEYK